MSLVFLPLKIEPKFRSESLKFLCKVSQGEGVAKLNVPRVSARCRHEEQSATHSDLLFFGDEDIKLRELTQEELYKYR